MENWEEVQEMQSEIEVPAPKENVDVPAGHNEVQVLEVDPVEEE